MGEPDVIAPRAEESAAASEACFNDTATTEIYTALNTL
eukprot:COSAG01_NODE_68531_length_264_cov_0.315152_1_plen_37_part_01